VFWNCGAEAQRAWLDEIQEAMGPERAELLDESIDVLVGAPENAVTFNEVSLRELTLPRMSILTLALAQSVALDHLERDVAAALQRFEPVVTDLEATGKLGLPVRDALRAIGFALKVRSSVLANLTLFDKPPETWESEMLERLDNQPYDFFDLEERLSAIHRKVAYFTDMSSTLTGVLNQRRNWLLEVAVVALILLEVVIFIWSLAR
jgi:required for meiotic nuclear division protein 1